MNRFQFPRLIWWRRGKKGRKSLGKLKPPFESSDIILSNWKKYSPKGFSTLCGPNEMKLFATCSHVYNRVSKRAGGSNRRPYRLPVVIASFRFSPSPKHFNEPSKVQKKQTNGKPKNISFQIFSMKQENFSKRSERSLALHSAASGQTIPLTECDCSERSVQSSSKLVSTIFAELHPAAAVMLIQTYEFAQRR